MRILVVGCGRVGAALAQSMSVAGHNVTVVDVKPTAFDRLGMSFRGRTVQGICFDRDVLRRAGIESAEAFAAVTSSDNANALAARVARDRFQVRRVVARIYNPERRALYERMGLQTVSSASWGAKEIERLLTCPEFDTLLSIGDGSVQVVQIIIADSLDNRPAAWLMLPDQTTLIAITRAGRTLMPRADMAFVNGDIVTLAARSEVLERVKRIVESGQEA